MDKIRKWHYTCKAEKMVNKLKEKHYDAYLANDLNEAKKIVNDIIPEEASIALGGSITLNEMGLVEFFREGSYELYDRYNQPSWPDTVECMRQSMLADYLVTGTNAITKNGELINNDCTGNRVAGMIFGPKEVVIIAGVNKIVPTIEDGFKRLKDIAPLNVKRIGHKTPCIESGECEDCQIPDRMCNYTTIIHHGMKFKNRIHIIMVADEVGY
ncbi:lactate utilization protein [Vallitalea okinawensis]|uniref:lactate utilization protein n=1 Tax=Vallitalea okinawensis TaxID=2078660 RepID=UPI000CFD1977|nr:lactate utilization protein [Vallitalea okinawensis]